MNILYTCDNNYVWLMSISMISLFESNKKNHITVYLIGENIDSKNKQKLYDIAKNYDQQCIIVDLPDLNICQYLYTKRWPKSAFSRLFSGEILQDNVKKILYIDCDTIIKEDLQELFEDPELEKYPINGVKDCISGFYKQNIGLSKNSIYVNAGVLLINLEQVRKMNMLEEINQFIGNTKYGKQINYADQDILNYIFKDHIGVIPLKYNVRTLEFVYTYKEIIKLRKPNNYYNEKDINEAKQKPYIIHYTTNMNVIRPWFSNSNHPRKADFINIFSNQEYFSKKLNEFSSKGFKNKFFNFFLKLPKNIGYSFLGYIHSVVTPLLRRIK